MLKISNRQENFLNNIESEFIETIEDKLNVFFDLCIKKSFAYSLMLSENARYYTKGSFEIMVLSSVEVENLIRNIFFEINNNFNLDFKLSNLNSNIINNIELNPVLIASINEYSRSLKIIDRCENVINKTISKAINLGSSNRLMSYIIKGKNIGAFILGNNNYANTQFEYRKEIYNQIEGILLNTKCSIKNQLINYIIRTLKMDELKSEEKFKITA